MSTRIAIPHARAAIVMASLLFGLPSIAAAQVSIGIGLPSVSIGINVPLYPNLVPVPGYPVYYDPRQHSNLFFYDGLYWVYTQENWYTSSWYNGPWDLVYPEMVPDFVLRVPVRFYRHPPRYFFGWNREGPPRWGEHWGHDWDERRHGWDHWDRASIPERAPLPRYQRQYSRSHYPSAYEQRTLRDRNYRYQPHEEVARRHFEQTPGRDHESRRPTDERHVERPPNEDRRRVPSPPGRSTADGQHGQSDRRAAEERGRPNVPPPDSHRGHTATPGDRGPAPERRDAPSPRSQPEHRDPQRVNPSAQQPQRRPAQERAREPARQPPREPDRESPPRSRSDKSQE